VSIKCLTPGITIRYTKDGSDPTPTHGTIGTTVKITAACTTLRAIAYRTGYINSDITSATYYIGTVATPVFSLPPTKTYSVTNSVTISCAAADSIHYTTDGTTPTEASTVYTGPIILDHPMTIKAIAVKTHMMSSAVASATYKVCFPIQPIFDATGTDLSEKTVTITCTDIDAIIRYTINGTEPTTTSPIIRSGQAIQIARTLNLKAKAFKAFWAPSATTTALYTVNTSGIVAAPVFSPLSGIYGVGNNITISCSTPSATIRYTIDGTTPTGASTLYTNPILFTQPIVIKAKAFHDTMKSSAVVTGTYNAILPRPEFSSSIGTGEQPITITCAVEGSTIRYTTNGTEPVATSQSIPSGGMVLVNKSMTLKAKAFKTGWLPSPTQTTKYTITQVATPTFSLVEGVYPKTQKLIISCATTGAVIHYTTDGSIPTAASSKSPSTGIIISTTTTLKVIAIKSGMTDSNIRSATYTITGTVATPTFYCISKNIQIAASTNISTYASQLWVNVSCTTEGAEIHYTTNGKEPTISDPIVASGSALAIDATTTLKAKAFKDTWLPSTTQTQVFSILQVATPDINISGATATITCTTPGAIIRYTINGVDPTSSDPVLSPGAKITIGSDTTLKAKAWKSGLVPSQVSIARHEYILTVNNDGNGNTTPSGNVTVNHGVNTVISATPAASYHFVNWIKTAGSGSVVFTNATMASTAVKVTGGDATIRANFSNQYTLTVTNNGNGNTNPSNVITVINGASTEITAVPNTGYAFANWVKSDGTGIVSFTDANSASTTVTISGGNATIRANFMPSHTLSITNDGNGSTTPSGSITVPDNISRAITAIPNETCAFINWTKKAGTGAVVFGDANSSSTTVTLTGNNATIQANFTIPYDTWVPGSINAGGSQWYCFKTTIGEL
jgi:hypothetical protein